MTTAVLRPDGPQNTGGLVSVVGGGSAWNVWSDNSDASYASYTALTGWYTVSFNTVSIPANALIRSVRVRLRHDQNVDVSTYRTFTLRVREGATFVDHQSEQLAVHYGTIAIQAGQDWTTNPHGQPWTQTDIDNLCVIVKNVGSSRASFRAHEVYVDVTYDEAPTATGDLPNGTVDTNRPTFQWTFSDPENGSQERFRVCVVNTAKMVGGFDPNTFTDWDADSGVQFSSANNWACNVSLTQGSTYRAYIFVSDAGSNGRWNTVTLTGPYAYVTIDVDQPAAPYVEVTGAFNPDGSITLEVYDNQNILPQDGDSSIEVGTIQSWFLTTNCNLNTGPAATAEFGNRALDIASTAAADNTFLSGYALPWSPSWASGVPISGRMAFKAATTGRNVRAEIWWYDASGTFLSKIQGPAITTSTSAWRAAFVTGVAPVGATQARLAGVVVAAANGEHHYMDGAVLVPHAINMFENPSFTGDANGDGVADKWSAFKFPDPGPAVVSYALDPASGVAGEGAQQFLWSGNSAGAVGLSQTTPYLVSGAQYTFTAHVKLSGGTSDFRVYCPNLGGIQTLSAASDGEWHEVSHTFTATASGVDTIYLQSVDASGDIQIGQVQLELGNVASRMNNNARPYVRSGYANTRVQIQRSYDNGVSWLDVERLLYGDTPGVDYQNAPFAFSKYWGFQDWEARRDSVYLPMYRARVLASVNNVQVVSPWSNWAQIPTPLSALRTWMLTAIETNPSDNHVRLFLHSPTVNFESTKRQWSASPLGREFPVVLNGMTSGEVFTLEFAFPDAGTWTAYDLFETIRKLDEVLLLQSPYGDYMFVQIVGTRKRSVHANPQGVVKPIVSVSFLEVDDPGV